MYIVILDYCGEKHPMPAGEFAKWVKMEACVAFYDAAAVKHDNVMQPLDWAVSTLLQAPIRRYKPLQDLTRDSAQLWAECNQALEKLGKDIPLESDDALLKQGGVEACFKAFMAPVGIGPSIAAKTLHKKRPQLIPVIDDYVSTVLTGRRGGTLDESLITDVVFDTFRPQLLKNLHALGEVVKALGDLSLSKCRLLDLAIWRHADAHKSKYGL
jgi:Family of unknown function (DUF6308)